MSNNYEELVKIIPHKDRLRVIRLLANGLVAGHVYSAIDSMKRVCDKNGCNILILNELKIHLEADNGRAICKTPVGDRNRITYDIDKVTCLICQQYINTWKERLKSNESETE
jgi:hypothetical protein